MFYSFEDLCKQRGGKFFYAYKAGTIGIKSIKDRDLAEIKVDILGQQLIEKITTESMRVQDRSSLRLSAILSNGLIRIHRAQVDKLLEQCGSDKGLAYGDLDEIVHIMPSSTEDSNKLSSPELVVVKKRKPRRPRKKPATNIIDIVAFRTPVAERQPEQERIDVDVAYIPKLSALLPQLDTMEIQIQPPIEQDVDALRYGFPDLDDSPPMPVQRNIIVEVDVHAPFDGIVAEIEPMQLPDGIVAEIEPMQLPDLGRAPAADFIELQPTIMQSRLQGEQDLRAMPPPCTPTRTVRSRTPQPKPQDVSHAVLQKLPRKINRDLQMEAILKPKHSPKKPISVSFMELIDYALIEDVDTDFVGDDNQSYNEELRLRNESNADTLRGQQSLESIKTPQVSLHSLPHFEIMKSHENIVPEEEIFDAPLERTIMQPIMEEMGPLDFKKLSERAQRLLEVLRKYNAPLKISIDDLCGKPLHKKEIVRVFLGLLEIYANTNIIDLVTKSNEDLYLDHIFITAFHKKLL